MGKLGEDSGVTFDISDGKIVAHDAKGRNVIVSGMPRKVPESKISACRHFFKTTRFEVRELDSRNVLVTPRCTLFGGTVLGDPVHGITEVHADGVEFPESPKGDRLAAGGRLYRGEFLVSGNKCFMLLMRHTGNLELYHKDFGRLWDSETAGYPVREFVVQSDAKCYLYDESGKVVKLVLGDWINPDACRPILCMQDDGNLCFYRHHRPDGDWRDFSGYLDGVDGSRRFLARRDARK